MDRRGFLGRVAAGIAGALAARLPGGGRRAAVDRAADSVLDRTTYSFMNFRVTPWYGATDTLTFSDGSVLTFRDSCMPQTCIYTPAVAGTKTFTLSGPPADSGPPMPAV